MTFTTQWLTNTAYGYPRGAERGMARVTHLMCIHITANPSTPPATAQQERDFANRAGSDGPSAHDYLDRNGNGIHAIDPKYAAWSNGVLRSPKTSVPGVAAVVAAKAQGWNPNECYYREVECCGRYPDYPITVNQIDTLARLIAADSMETGIPISRATVHLHSDLDTVNRPNCPVPSATAEVFVAAVIEKAQCIRTTSALGEALLQITALEKENASLDATIVAMNAELLDLEKQLEKAETRITSASLLLQQGTENKALMTLIGETSA